MGKTWIQKGDTITFTAPSGGVTAGTPVKIGQLVVIPAESVAETLSFEGYAVGVHGPVAKVAGAAWTEGALLYFVAASSSFGTTASGNTLAGVAAKAAASADTTGYIRLNGAGAAQSA